MAKLLVTNDDETIVCVVSESEDGYPVECRACQMQDLAYAFDKAIAFAEIHVDIQCRDKED